MNNDLELKKAKLEMWQKKRLQAEEDYKDALKRKGEAAREGDVVGDGRLRPNERKQPYRPAADHFLRL